MNVFNQKKNKNLKRFKLFIRDFDTDVSSSGI